MGTSEVGCRNNGLGAFQVLKNNWLDIVTWNRPKTEIRIKKTTISNKPNAVVNVTRCWLRFFGLYNVGVFPLHTLSSTFFCFVRMCVLCWPYYIAFYERQANITFFIFSSLSLSWSIWGGGVAISFPSNATMLENVNRPGLRERGVPAAASRIDVKSRIWGVTQICAIPKCELFFLDSLSYNS